MRKGFLGTALKVENGKIVMLATGADACAEHERGSAPLQRLLSTVGSLEDVRKAYKQNQKDSLSRAWDWLRGKISQLPQVLEVKRITHTESVRFLEGVDPQAKVPRAFITATGTSGYRSFESLCGICPHPHRDTEYSFVGAWDENGFCAGVSGDENIALLKDFFERIAAREVAQAGLYIEDVFVAGVILADVSWLTEHYAQQIKEVQDVENSRY